MTPSASRLRVHSKLGGDTARTTAGHRDVPYNMMLCSAIKAARSKKEGGMFGVMAFYLLKQLLQVESCFLGDG